MPAGRIAAANVSSPARFLPTVHVVLIGRVQCPDLTGNTGSTTSVERDRLSTRALRGDSCGLTCTTWTDGRMSGADGARRRDGARRPDGDGPTGPDGAARRGADRPDRPARRRPPDGDGTTAQRGAPGIANAGAPDAGVRCPRVLDRGGRPGRAVNVLVASRSAVCAAQDGTDRADGGDRGSRRGPDAHRDRSP